MKLRSHNLLQVRTNDGKYRSNLIGEVVLILHFRGETASEKTITNKVSPRNETKDGTSSTFYSLLIELVGPAALGREAVGERKHLHALRLKTCHTPHQHNAAMVK